MILHAAVAMSNHVHVVATDTHASYPDFLRDFHGLLARVVNAWRGRWEYFWDANQPSAVLLEDEAAQIDKLGYVLTNPVGLVARAAEWPGATALHSILTEVPVVAFRPRHFFRDDDQGGSMPDAVTLFFQAPPALARLARPEYAALLRDHVATVEAKAAAARKSTGCGVLGPKRILAQRWNNRPQTAEPRRQISPAVACRDKWRRIERLKQNKLFQTLYRAAFDSFRSGLAALFPPGTWCMRFRAAIQIGTA